MLRLLTSGRATHLPHFTGRRGRLGARLVAAFIGLALGGVIGLASVGYILWPRWPSVEANAAVPTLPITINNVAFNVPPAAIRFPLQRRAGMQPRLDLAFLWPALTPPDPGIRPAPSVDPKLVPKPADQLFLSIATPQGALPLRERLRTIYPRYADGETFPGPEGLLGLAFREDSPYRGEDLFFPEGQPEAFLVRCTRPNVAIEGNCLLERNADGAEITVRFPRGWLSEWAQLSAAIDQLIGRLRHHG